MKKILLLALMASTPICAQSDFTRIYETNEMLNGRFWLIASKETRAGFVAGYESGSTYSLVLAGTKLTEPEFAAAVRKVYPVGVTREETMKFLDQFFATPENGRLAIAQGIEIFAMRMQGKSSTEIETMLRSMRASLP